MSGKKIFIVAGEPSGDLYASTLVRDLRELDPAISFSGIGGSLSKEAGVRISFDISRLALVGIVEVLKNISVVGKAFRAALAEIDRSRPDLAVLVDYPGFNLRLARELKRRSIPVVYYISPQVWVWGKGRIGIIKRCVRKILVFFAFEEELYKKHGVDAAFVGHPLVETARAGLSKDAAREKFGLARGRTTVALLPGSRRTEVAALLPVMARAAALMRARGLDLQFLVAKYRDLGFEPYRNALEGAGLEAKIVDHDTYNALAAADFAIVASGTATLETAIIGTPLVVVYKTHPLTAAIARMVADVRILGLVNILAGKEIAPEFIQEDATAEKIAAGVSALLADTERLAAMREALGRVKTSLGEPGASKRAAREIYALLEG